MRLWLLLLSFTAGDSYVSTSPPEYYRSLGECRAHGRSNIVVVNHYYRVPWKCVQRQVPR